MLDGRQRRLLFLLALACFTEGYDFNALIVALPHLRHEFGLGKAAADLWVAAVYLGAAPAVWLGRRADRHGRRGALMLSVAGYSICSVVTALAPNMPVFVAMQFLARAFLVVQIAVAWTVAAEELPAARRGFGFGLLALSSALGTGMGAILEAAVLAPLDASWRWIYAASAPVALVLVALRRSLPESARYEELAASGRMHGLARVLFQPPYRSRLLLIGGTVAIANLTTQATVFAIDYMQTERHLGASAANLVLVAAGTICLPVLTSAGRLSDRWGRRPVCAVALVVQAVGIVLFFNVATTLPLLLATLAVTYVGVFGAWTTGSAFGVEAFPTALRATAGSAVTMARLVGQCASFLVSALLVGAVGHPGVVVAFLGLGPLAAAALIATRFPETSREELADAAVVAGVIPPAPLSATHTPGSTPAA